MVNDSLIYDGRATHLIICAANGDGSSRSAR